MSITISMRATSLFLGLLTAGLITTWAGWAQPVPLTTPFWQNRQLLNPASAGMGGPVEVGAGFRRHTLMPESPSTFYAFGAVDVTAKPAAPSPAPPPLRTPLTSSMTFDQRASRSVDQARRMRHVMGGQVQHDVTGPTGFTQLGGSYAAHIPVGERTSLALGGGVNLFNMRLRAGDFNVNDSRVSQLATNQWQFNAQVGGMLYNHRSFLGYSAVNLLLHQFEGDQPIMTGTRGAQHLIMAGHRIGLTETLDLDLNVLGRLSSTHPALFEGQARITYENLFWLGTGARTNQDVLALVGLALGRQLSLSYSYDIPTSREWSGRPSQGAHEIALFLRMPSR